MSLKLVWRAPRSKAKDKRPTAYIEGTDYRGRRVHESLRTSDRDLAKALYAKRIGELATMRAEGPMAVANFANAVKVYLEHRPDTSNNAYLAEMLELIGTRKLCEFKQSDLDELAKTMRPNTSAATRVRHVYTPFIAAWNAAAQTEPPLAEHRKWKKPTVPEFIAKCPTDEEITKLIAAAAAGPDPERDVAAILFLTFTGTRTGEAWRVRIADLDLARGYAVLRNVKAKHGDVRRRQVALTPDLVKALWVQLERLPSDPQTRVFEFATRWGMPQMIARALQRAGLPKYRPHEIGRHAFASRLLRSGASLLDVARAGGWQGVKMVDKFYGHLAQERIDGLVSGQRIAGSPQSVPTPNLHPQRKKDAKS
jgi:integrase